MQTAEQRVHAETGEKENQKRESNVNMVGPVASHPGNAAVVERHHEPWMSFFMASLCCIMSV